MPGLARGCKPQSHVLNNGPGPAQKLRRLRAGIHVRADLGRVLHLLKLPRTEFIEKDLRLR